MKPPISDYPLRRTSNMMDYLSEEILLEVLSYLTLNELSIIARVSNKLNRLAEDPKLWKTMYQLRWGYHRLKYPFLPALEQRNRHTTHGSRLLIADRKGKGRQQAVAEQVQLGHTWKNLCRISLNWQTGSAQSTTLVPNLDHSTTPRTRSPSIIVRFHRSLLFTASRTRFANVSPTVDVYQLRKGAQDDQINRPEKPIGRIISTALNFSQSGTVGISEIRLDERCDSESGMNELPFSSINTVIVAVFYTTGQFSLFQIGLPLADSECLEELEVIELYASSEVLGRTGSDAIHHQAAESARFHYPLLITCSTDFLLRFYELIPKGPSLTVRKLRLDMRSQTCFWPLSLNLTALELGFRLTIVYPTPFYPSAWTVSLQEFEVQLSPNPLVSGTRHTTAIPLETLNKLNPHPSSPMLGIGPVSGIEYAEPTVVVARTDNTIDTFRYHRGISDGPELLHRRTLYGHTSKVAAVALNSSGRCVSAAQDGLNVWELGEGQPSEPVRVDIEQTEYQRVEWVGFDTEKIVGVLRVGGKLCGTEDGIHNLNSEEEVRVLSFA